jgi:hypothetical protein
LCDEFVPTSRRSREEDRAAWRLPPRLAVEKATGVKVTDTELIEDGKKRGLLGSFANLDKVVTDRQMVMLLLLDEADKANEISEQIEGALPPQAKTLEHENALVFYASQGKGHSAAIDKALSAL